MGKHLKSSPLLLLTLLGCFSCERGETGGVAFQQSAVEDGTETSNYRWSLGVRIHSALTGNPWWSCSGTLIAPNLVLTARHCFDTAEDEVFVTTENSSNVLPTAASAGHYKRGHELILHPQTDRYWSTDDLALVILESNVPSTEAVPATPAIQHRISNTRRHSRKVAMVAFGKANNLQPSAEPYRVRRFRRGGDLLCASESFDSLQACKFWDFIASEDEQRRVMSYTVGVLGGDSGGAIIDDASLDTNPMVLGVNTSAYSDADGREQGAAGVRLDQYRDFIVEVALRAAEYGNYPAPAWTQAATPDPEDAIGTGPRETLVNLPSMPAPSTEDLLFFEDFEDGNAGWRGAGRGGFHTWGNKTSDDHPLVTRHEVEPENCEGHYAHEETRTGQRSRVAQTLASRVVVLEPTQSYCASGWIRLSDEPLATTAVDNGTSVKILLLSEGGSFAGSSSTILSAQDISESEILGGMIRGGWHFVQRTVSEEDGVFAIGFGRGSSGTVPVFDVDEIRLERGACPTTPTPREDSAQHGACPSSLPYCSSEGRCLASEPDAGVADAGAGDAGAGDAGAGDAGLDATTADAGVDAATPSDAGVDGTVSDAARSDAANSDAANDAGTMPGSSGGGCSMTPSSPRTGAWFFVGLGLALFATRRTRKRTATAKN